MIRLIFIIILLITGTIDAATRKIPNSAPLIITALAILRMIGDPASVASCITGCFVLSIPMLLLALRRGGLGGGDIKLTAACGLFLGTDALLTGFFIAMLLALIIRLILHLWNKECALAHSRAERGRLRLLHLRASAHPRGAFLSYRRRSFLYGKKQPLRDTFRDTFALGPFLSAGFILASVF